MNRSGFHELITTVSGAYKVWVDVVPKKALIPAFTYSHITGGGSRILNGTKVNEWDTWRVKVIGEKRVDTDAMIASLRTLDNTDNHNFKRIFIETIQAIPSDPDDKYINSFVDFMVYNR